MKLEKKAKKNHTRNYVAGLFDVDERHAKPIDAVLMFKTVVLQQLNNLSDDRIEYQIRDRLSFMRFLEFNLKVDPLVKTERGREHWYSAYRTRVCRVEREYGVGT